MRLGPSTLALAACCLLVVLAALGGCGSSSSSNGVASKTPMEIVAATKAAADGAQSAHVVGSIVSRGTPVTLDLDVVADQGGRGRLSEGGLGFEAIALGQTVYIRGSSEFYSHFGGARAVRLLQGRWLKSPATSGSFASLASLIDLHTLVDATLASPGALSEGATTTVNGRPAVAVRSGLQGTTLYVATTGPPYPVEVTRDGASGGKITFDRWNEPVSLAVPANAIDLSGLQSVH